MELEARKIAERDFHDNLRTVNDDSHVADTRWSPDIEETIAKNPMWTNMKYYAIERTSRDFILNWYRSHCPGKRILDYCCGNGDDSIQLARAGAAEVIGIDISDISIENCQRLAEREGVGSVCSFKVADAENTGFPDNHFDVINEYGCLHHLELDQAFAELARVVKPEGKVICNEALAHNIIIHLYRRLTPKLRTVWEVDHIMKKHSFELAKKHFNKVDMRFYYLFTLLAVPFRKTFFFKPLLSVLEKVDAVVLSLPWIKWQAWQTVFILSEPKKK